jgi:hypothetical protein
MDIGVVFGAPRVQADIAQSLHGKPARRARIQDAEAIPEAPGQTCEIGDIGGVEKRAPGLAVGAEPAIVVEVFAADPTPENRRAGWGSLDTDWCTRAPVRQRDDLVQHEIRGGVGGVEHAVEGGIEDVIADDEQPWVLVRIGKMVRAHIPQRVAARNGVDRREPAVHGGLSHLGPAVAERGGQCIEHSLNERRMIEIGKGEGIVAGDQPAEHAMRCHVVACALVVDAAAAEGVAHPPGSPRSSRARRVCRTRG